MDRNDLKLENVYCVYSGKSGYMCDRNGIYKYASKHKEYAEKKDKIKLAKTDISDISVKRIFNEVMKNPLSEIEIYDDEICFILEIDTRVNAVFFKL